MLFLLLTTTIVWVRGEQASCNNEEEERVLGTCASESREVVWNLSGCPALPSFDAGTKHLEGT